MKFSFLTPASSSRDISASFQNTVSHITSEQTHNLRLHIETLKQDKLFCWMQTSIFTGCISLHHSCSRCITGARSSSAFSERMAHGRKIKSINVLFLPTLIQCQIQNVTLESLHTQLFPSFVHPSYIYIQASLGCFRSDKKKKNAHKSTTLQAKCTSSHWCLFLLCPFHLSTDHPSIHNLLIGINGMREVVTCLQDVT